MENTEKMRELTQKESEHLDEMHSQLSELKASDWGVKVSDKMVNLLNSFESWDDKVIESFGQVFDEAYKKIVERWGEESPEIQSFVNKWNGWVGEASIREVVKRIGVKMKTSERLDMNGADGLMVLASEDESIFIFLSIKSAQSVPPGIHLMNANGINYDTDTFQNSLGKETDVRHIVKAYDTLKRHQEDGDIYNFCFEESIELREKFLEKNKSINPKTHESRMMIMFAGVGTQAQEKDPPYGWMETMQLVGRDRIYGNPIAKDFRKQLIDLVDDTEKLTKIE